MGGIGIHACRINRFIGCQIKIFTVERRVA